MYLKGKRSGKLVMVNLDQAHSLEADMDGNTIHIDFGANCNRGIIECENVHSAMEGILHAMTKKYEWYEVN